MIKLRRGLVLIQYHGNGLYNGGLFAFVTSVSLVTEIHLRFIHLVYAFIHL